MKFRTLLLSLLLVVGVSAPAFAQAPIEVVQRIRQSLPTPMSPADQGRLVTAVASELGSDWGVLLKPGGNNCPSPVGLISCDIIVQISAQQEYDILGDSEGAGVPRFDPVSDEHTGLPVKCGTPGKSGCDMARVVRVAPQPAPQPTPEQPAPTPAQPCDTSEISAKADRLQASVDALSAKLMALETLLAQLAQRPAGTAPDYKGSILGIPVTLRPVK